MCLDTNPYQALAPYQVKPNKSSSIRIHLHGHIPHRFQQTKHPHNFSPDDPAKIDTGKDFILIKNKRSKFKRKISSNKFPNAHNSTTKITKQRMNIRCNPKNFNSTNSNYSLPWKLSSLHASQTKLHPVTKTTMTAATSPSTIKQEPSSAAVVSPDNAPTMNVSPTLLTIDAHTDVKTIKAISVLDTWRTYIFNNNEPTITEDDWTKMSDDEKYAELIKLRITPTVISSPFTTFVITPVTPTKVIQKIPKKDCRILLKAYADSQGFNDFDSTIETMLVEPLRMELIKARDKLLTRPLMDPETDHNKLCTSGIPFVLTHATTDSEINSADETSLLQELQNMYTDRNLFDSVEWDSLHLSDLKDMAILERDEMLKCFSFKSSDTKKHSDKATVDVDPNGNPYVYIVDDEDSDVFSDNNDDVDDDVSMEDMDSDHKNEADEFVNEQKRNLTKERKIFRFEFTRHTTDKDIYSLSHKRAMKIAVQHAINIEDPLSDSFISDATTDEVYQYLIDERNEIQSQYEYQHFNFCSKTTDTAIKQLKRNQLEDYIIYHYRDTGRSLSDEFFTNKTDVELKILMMTERDMLRASDATSQRQYKLDDPKPPNTLPKGLHAKRQNLNGWNIDAAMSKSNTNLHNTVFHPKHNNSSDPNVVALSKNYFFIRAKISTEGNRTHLPTIVRRFVKALRNSDSTMQLQPFDKDDNDLNNILDTESLIPDDSTALLTWVRGLYTTKTRMYFSIRVSNTCPVSELRSDIFGWCKTNRCYIDMDYIDSEKLFSCGWISGLHPRLYNRNELKHWIDNIKTDEDMIDNIGSKIKLYPRTIFTVDDDGKKTITNAIIIEGAIEHSKDIMKFLYKIKWDTKYKNVNFVPFRTSSNFTKQDQKTAMQYHNNYLHNTYRKLVRIANPLHEYETEDGEKISFRMWLKQSQLHGANMIDGVELMKDGIVRIIYDKKHQQGVDYMMSTLRENAFEAFGEDIANDMLGDDFDIVTRFDSELEDQHTTRIKDTWERKKFEHVAPPPQKHNIFYGSNKSEKLYQQHGNKSYSEITQSTISQSDIQVAESIKENEELRNMVLELQNKFDALEKKQQTFTTTLKESLKQELMKEFEGLITGIRNDMNSAITAIETKFVTSIQQYEKNALAREERMNAQCLSNFRTVAGELLSKNNQITPSEATHLSVDLRGGDQ